MSRIRDIANLFSTGTDAATDAEVATAVSNHSSANDPHGDRAFASGLIPSQSGNSGKYLTTNGTAVSWGTVASGTDGATVIAYSFLGMGA